MTKKQSANIAFELKERAKELSCLYEVQELLNNKELSIDEIFKEVIKILPQGWQYPDICRVQIVFRDSVYESEDLKKTKWWLKSDIVVQEELLGSINVYYKEKRPNELIGPFLKEEQKLINTIAMQISSFILHKRLKAVFEEGGTVLKDQKPEWYTIFKMLKGTNPKLLVRISRKMINFMCWNGIKEAENLFEFFSPEYKDKIELLKEGNNRPYHETATSDLITTSYRIFELAGEHLDENELVDNIHRWIKEDRSGFLVNVLENNGSSLSEISSAIERFYHLSSQGLEISKAREKSVKISLIRRLLLDQLDFISIAKKFLEVSDFHKLLRKIISPLGSYGKLGGKSSGLFLSSHILWKMADKHPFFADIKVPKTWYITSDAILSFMKRNDLEDIMEQVFKDIDQVKKEYPYVVHVFKNSPFSPDIIKELSVALDDFGETPLVIRSSSLLEDRMNTAFAGKYKSLFVANKGTKEQRLLEFMDALAEVYASAFGPDPIEYRKERGLSEYHEEMGILIQEVVGKKVGKYFLPAFSGVAFSHNDFRWSNRIKKEDGLIRMVPGLGTRAVDRLSDDYPILVSPGQPGLRVNVAIEEIIRYSPKKIDVINLEKKSFETIDIQQLLAESGKEYPQIHNVVSQITEDFIQQPRKLYLDFEKNSYIVTFNGIINNSPFPKEIKTILDVLEEEYNCPIDIEFAHDGDNLYLLQCRPQSYSGTSMPAVIPYNISEDKIVFTASRFISNGIVSNIRHIVYVDPSKYGELQTYERFLAIGKIISSLNEILPKRQFILMGPGRWGSRGDIKLGVNVAYSDINNTAMLIEIARKQKNYMPELSMGTHFFQDLVESEIKYLPLYPDDPGNFFNENFFNNSVNILPDLLPGYSAFSDTVKVIDIADSSGGNMLHILMNADEERAYAILSEPVLQNDFNFFKTGNFSSSSNPDFHWRWRMNYAEHIASRLDKEKFGVIGFYVFGSVKNATAGPGSDIDVLIHFKGNENQRNDLLLWLDGWSLCLGRLNEIRTGTKTDKLLDIHIITDEDIQKRDSYAVKIGSSHDPALPLSLGTELNKETASD
ncbi:MAG: nucleotidyltransferase domain-containing protein [Prolixibacteraceae bacterium]|nr:nucleotidyltransferase domain-containing protein [Prolixibacteraceae bacterium]